MNCDDTRLELDAFVRGDAADSDGIRAHVDGCPSCRSDADFAEELAEALRATRSDALVDADAVADRVVAASKGVTRRRRAVSLRG